jgi:hypothetical protein
MIGVLYVAFCLLFSSAASMKHDLRIEKDTRSLFKIETFGFQEGGVIDLKVSKFSVSNFHASTERAGFVMRKAKSESSAQNDLEKIMERNECIFDVLNNGQGDGDQDGKNNNDISFELKQDDWKSFEKKIVIKGKS